MLKVILSLFLLISSSFAMDSKTKRAALSKEAKAQVLKVLEVNEVLHASFFKYNAKAVEKSATDLRKAISSITDANIAKLLKFSSTKLSEITSNKNQDENYKNYNLVSMALIHIVNKYDVGSKYNAYSCPMVKKKWVQNSKKMDMVHNPYSADMPHCGTKDTNY